MWGLGPTIERLSSRRSKLAEGVLWMRSWRRLLLMALAMGVICVAFSFITITMPWNIQRCNEGSTVRLVVGSHQRMPSRRRSLWMETLVVLRVVFE